jgi:hypothetical protein
LAIRAGIVDARAARIAEVGAHPPPAPPVILPLLVSVVIVPELLIPAAPVP